MIAPLLFSALVIAYHTGGITSHVLGNRSKWVLMRTLAASPLCGVPFLMSHENVTALWWVLSGSLAAGLLLDWWFKILQYNIGPTGAAGEFRLHDVFFHEDTPWGYLVIHHDLGWLKFHFDLGLPCEGGFEWLSKGVTAHLEWKDGGELVAIRKPKN